MYFKERWVRVFGRELKAFPREKEKTMGKRVNRAIKLLNSSVCCFENEVGYRRGKGVNMEM
jgi:hypothetical protein